MITETASHVTRGTGNSSLRRLKARRTLESDYLAPVRMEWLVGVSRALLAGSALLAVQFDHGVILRGGLAAYLYGYFFFSVGILALTWSPIKFARGGDIVLHVFDVASFSVFTLATNGIAGPFFVFVIFLLASATIRWQVPGALWTALGVLGTYGGVTVYAVVALHAPEFNVNTFITRAVSLSVITPLVGYLGAHYYRSAEDISDLAAWPREMSRNPRDTVLEILSHAIKLLNGKRIVLAWEDPIEGQLNVSWLAGEKVVTEDAAIAYESLVVPALQTRTFQTVNANDEQERVVTLTPRGFLRRRCRPVHERIRMRFNMRAVQSWPLSGQLVRGRLFCLDVPHMALDDLIFGQFVARVAGSRLDNVYKMVRLRDATALEERVRVARDLHDGLLQSQAGAALQLMAARNLLDRDPDAARKRLEHVQEQLERSELEMRAFVRELRPTPIRRQTEVDSAHLRERLERLRQSIERQWGVQVTFALDTAIDLLTSDVATHVYRLVQEAVVNAARHANASHIRATVSRYVNEMHLTIADDGRGFPFAGTFDLTTLCETGRGPATLKERVAELRGDLTLTSSRESGTQLLITVPLASA
jgi:signal transduction histidine kinase